MSSLISRSKWMSVVIDSKSTYDSWEHGPGRNAHRNTVSPFLYRAYKWERTISLDLIYK